MDRGDLRSALDWATAGVELCLQRGAVEDRQAGPRPDLGGDDSELRLLLSLRYRIRNDLGLPEDDYDRMLDEHPPARPGRHPQGGRLRAAYLVAAAPRQPVAAPRAGGRADAR